MRSLLLSLAFSLSGMLAVAQGLAGGEMTVWTDTVEGRPHIVIRLLLINSPGSAPLGAMVNTQVYFDEVYQGNHAVLLQPGTGLGNSLCQKDTGTFDLYEYRSSFVAPVNPQRVRVQLSRCCRLSADNYSQSPGFYLSASYDMNQGFNKRYDIKTPLALFSNVGDSISINHLANEPEGDSLHFSIDTPRYWSQGMAQPVFNYGHPIAAASMQFQIHPKNGKLTWMPSGSGTFAYRIKIEEFRFDAGQGQHFKIAEYSRDIVTVASTDMPGYSFEQAPLSGFQYREKGVPVYEVALGQTATVQLDFSQVDTSGFALSVHGGPFDFDVANTTMTISYPGANQVSCALEWETVGQYFEAGPHYFTLRVTQNCVVYDVLLAIKLLGPIGIPEKEITTGKIFPNPSQSGSLVIQSEMLKNRNCQVSIYSLTGQLVYQTSPLQTPEGQMEIHPNLPPGLYLIRVSDEEKGKVFRWVRE